MGLLDQYDKAKKYAAGLLAQVPQNAQDIYQGFLSAPSQVSDLFSQQKAQQLAKALKNPQQANPKQWMDAGMNLAGMAPVMGLLGHTVYHGSPHKFTKFDMGKIGTGEGAQAYGHGLYFAEAPDVAQSYAGKAATQIIQKPDGTYRAMVLDPSGNPHAAQNFQSKELADAFAKEAQAKFGDGSMYKVDIPDEAIPKMLDWDKPLSEQAPEVQAAAKNLGITDAVNGEDLLWKIKRTKYDAREAMQGNTGLNEAGVYATQQLKEHGIPGIRYLDGSSRTAGQGTSNYVLFDDQLPRILEVNGQPTGLKPWKTKLKPWKTKDVFGDGRQIEHVSPDGRSAVVQQTLPSGKTVFYPADVNAQYGWVSPDLYKPFDSFDAAQKKIKGMRISDAAKARNTERYGGIPSHWTGDAKKLAKSLIDNDVPISRFSGSTQSKSKYIELADGRKIRMSDHDLPMSYEAADIDFRYGNDITEIINKLK